MSIFGRSASQSAGDSSIQIQAQGSVYVGVDEARAREIAHDIAKQVLLEFTHEAHEVIQERISALDDRVIASLFRSGRIGAFSDPSFLRSYKKAQSGAASSERQVDYDLLASLLEDRADRGADRLVRVGIERSIEIIDQVDEVALRGLTVAQAVAQYHPTSPHVFEGLDTLDLLFKDLLDGPLPTGSRWIEHLDLLDAVRADNIQTFKKHDLLVSERLTGYSCAGVPEFAPLARQLEVDGKFVDVAPLLIPHELRPGFVRARAATKADFEALLERAFGADPDGVREGLVSWAVELLGLGVRNDQASTELMLHYRSRPHLQAVAEWWDSLSMYFRATDLGRVLARANAHRLDSRGVLPPID